ncbi:uncharacterized protein LAESUDRAFT_730976, partial [Laetiporus sulphureus 93-53]
SHSRPTLMTWACWRLAPLSSSLLTTSSVPTRLFHTTSTFAWLLTSTIRPPPSPLYKASRSPSHSFCQHHSPRASPALLMPSACRPPAWFLAGWSTV